MNLKSNKCIIFANAIVAGGCISLLLTGMLLAERPSLPQWKKRRSALEKVHIVGEFRIFYTLQGDDALVESNDDNDHSVPDQIENLALQLTTARDFYVEVLKLRHPLESPRYKEKAKFIDVNVGTLPLSTVFNPDKTRGNGSAGDAVVNYHRPCDDSAGGVDVLTMDISKSLSIGNLSPAHELFHLFQYGYTVFKNNWFLEGTARWVESAFRKGGGTPKALPLTENEQKKLFAMSYDADGFWNELARAGDSRGKLKLPSELRHQSYIGSKKPIIEDAEFYGVAFIKPLLEALDAADDRANAGSKLEVFTWSESRQRSSENNSHIWSAVLKAANDYAPRSKAVRSLMKNLPADDG